MSFAWPWLLTLLAVPPAMVLAYVIWLRRKRRYAVKFASLALVRAAAGSQSQWRRHLPFALMTMAVVALALATTRPQATVQVPHTRTSIVLTMDVSRSMCATDIEPNRLTVAQEAAVAFIDDQPAGTQMGIVAFAGFAELVVPPTRDKAALVEAIASFSTSYGTVTGSAMLKAVDTIAEMNPRVEPVDTAEIDPDFVRRPGDDDYVADIIVVLTDGASVGGVEPLLAAEIVADRRVRVYAIGFGTSDPGPLGCTPEQAGTGGSRWFDEVAAESRAARRFLVIDEDTLQAVADITGGQYFRAENADQLVQVFEDLPEVIVRQSEEVEITVHFVLAGTILAIAALVLSLRWNRTS